MRKTNRKILFVNILLFQPCIPRANVAYLLFRDLSSLVFFAWIPMPIPEFSRNVIIQLPEASPLFYVIRFNLNGMFWLVSGVLFLRCVLFYRIKAQRIYIWGFYAFGAIQEIAQVSENVPGTFDPLDLLFMGIGAFVEGLLYNFSVKRTIA